MFCLLLCDTDVPDPPVQLTLFDPKERSVKLNWERAADHNSPITGKSDLMYSTYVLKSRTNFNMTKVRQLSIKVLFMVNTVVYIFSTFEVCLALSRFK